MSFSTAIFDLDGTLIQPEKLKARSYAMAARDLRPELDETGVIDAYRNEVGKSRKAVAVALLTKFGLEQAARTRMERTSVRSPWQAYVGVRLRYYQNMIDDPELIRDNVSAEAVKLARALSERVEHLALATTSRSKQTDAILSALELRDVFECVVTADEVEETKPNPEA